MPALTKSYIKLTHFAPCFLAIERKKSTYTDSSWPTLCPTRFQQNLHTEADQKQWPVQNNVIAIIVADLHRLLKPDNPLNWSPVSKKKRDDTQDVSKLGSVIPNLGGVLCRLSFAGHIVIISTTQLSIEQQSYCDLHLSIVCTLSVHLYVCV